MLVVSVSVSLSDGFGAEFAQLLFYFFSCYNELVKNIICAMK